MIERLPLQDKAIKLLEKSSCPPNVIQHCKTVAKLAVKMAKILQKKGFRVDVELVETGALLHDIGRSKTHTVDHAIIGAKIAESAGMPEAVSKIIERHVGGGIPQDEAVRLGWPEKNYLPETLEERIVTYADKLVEGNKKVPINKTIAQFSRKLGKDHPSISRLKALDEEFQSLLGGS
ncbi:MAG TPA: TIGR00295 family protein [Candidatus Bathyarchaeia archaeon]|nr:TIGR00295 family protein [Candidatus Bathyarchaeia archaeon]